MLISKEDFHKLVKTEVNKLNGRELSNQSTHLTSKDTIVDLISALYWPQVRQLEWWHDEETMSLEQWHSNSNAGQWVTWHCHWMRYEVLSCVGDIAAVPGKDDPEGKIHCIFELGKDV
jgi:hypothetical protein